MADEPENMTLALLREIRGDIASVREEMREGFQRVDERFDKFETNAAASDAENAKILETITNDIADLKTIFVDVQARVVRNEKRVQKLEKARPEA